MARQSALTTQRTAPKRQRSLLVSLASIILPLVGLVIALFVVIHVFKPPGESNTSGKPIQANTTVISPELQAAEQMVLNQIQSVQTAKIRVATASSNRDLLHNTYKGKVLPRAQFDAVELRYKAADDEVEKASSALSAAQANFQAALSYYQRLGGKKSYNAQL